MTKLLSIATTLFLSSTTISAWAVAADQQVGTLTQVEGTVKVFTNPSKTLPKQESKEGTRALFEGEYYLVRDAKIGDRLEQGNLLRTAPGAKARVVFENGDQYNVGPGTAYRVKWKKDDANAAAASPQVDLMYGKLRGLIAKGGPRSKLTVKTPSASMGVRGTDFFIASEAADKGTEVSVIRGSVEVKPEIPAEEKKKLEASGVKIAEPKPIAVKEGNTAEIAPPPVPAPTHVESEAKTEPKKVSPVIELRKTTQEDFAGIEKSSEIRAAEKRELASKADAKVAEKIEKLEKKAIETTVKDIQTRNPDLLKGIDLQKVTSATELHEKAVARLAVEAPKAPEKRKPYKNELDNLEGSAYEKYFKPATQ